MSFQSVTRDEENVWEIQEKKEKIHSRLDYVWDKAKKKKENWLLKITNQVS